MSHGIHKCKTCKKVVLQCRCFKHNEVYFDMECDDCKKVAQMSKPREFWIAEIIPESNYKTKSFLNVYEGKPEQDSWIGWNALFIEKSAFDEQAEKIKKLENKLAYEKSQTKRCEAAYQDINEMRKRKNIRIKELEANNRILHELIDRQKIVMAKMREGYKTAPIWIKENDAAKERIKELESEVLKLKGLLNE